MKELVFQLWSDESGVFFTKEDYVLLKSIESAMEKALTWGDFERLCPTIEFEALGLWQSNEGEKIYRDGESIRFLTDPDLETFLADYGEEGIINSQAEFDRDAIPGVPDGDYPPWTCRTADTNLPHEFVKEFGEGGGSPASGSWLEFPVSRLKEMTQALGKYGYRMTAHLSYDLGWWRQIDLT